MNDIGEHAVQCFAVQISVVYRNAMQLSPEQYTLCCSTVQGDVVQCKAMDIAV